jgi:putative ABC transport system ATP-binding protein
MRLSLAIKLANVTKVYYRDKIASPALTGIDLTIEHGEFVAIIGQSGAGKSTLMNIIGLLDKPTSGSYALDGIEVAHLSDDELSNIRNQKIGFVFQSFFLLPRLTALQNIMLPTVYQRNGPVGTEAEARAILEKVSMAGLADNKPYQLSGGQQQRVAIARALMCQPSVILADEPTGALDSKTGQEVLELFKTLNRTDKVTIVIVTHDLAIAKQCQRIITIKDGKIIKEN